MVLCKCLYLYNTALCFDVFVNDMICLTLPGQLCTKPTTTFFLYRLYFTLFLTIVSVQQIRRNETLSITSTITYLFGC